MDNAVRQLGVDTDMPVFLGYTGAEDTLLRRYREACGDLWPADAPETIIGSVIGTHGGAGAVAVAFFRKAKASAAPSLDGAALAFVTDSRIPRCAVWADSKIPGD